MLIEEEFEDMEAMYPYFRMKEAGFEVEVVGPSKKTYHGKYGYPLQATMLAEDCDLDDTACVIIPGGQAPDRMRRDKLMVSLVKNAVSKGLVIGAICHGPQMLIEAGVVRGREITCYASVKTDLKNAGARFFDSEVVVDGNIVTSRTPEDLPAFLKTLIEMIHGEVPAIAIGPPLLR